MAAGLRLRAGKGLEFNVAAEAAARALDPRESRLGRRRAACPGQVSYCPGAKGPRRGPRSIMHTVLQVTGLELVDRTGRRPVGGHPLLPSSFLAARSSLYDYSMIRS